MGIPFRTLPGMTDLFIDYVTDWAKVRGFYRHPYSMESILAFARKRAGADLPHRDVLCRTLAAQQKSWGGSTESIDKLARGAVAVVVGQQAGLFTGPLYTILKAVTAIKLARSITEAGVTAVPIFWIASEDNDYAEIESSYILDRDSALHKLQVDLANTDSTPVGWLKFKADVGEMVAQCLASLPQSEFQADLRTILEDSYKADDSPVNAFARMMVRLFGSAGLILVDPLDLGMKSIAEPLLRQVAERNKEVRQAVMARSRSLSEAGYHEQVKVDSNFTGLFAYRGKSRLVVRPDEVVSSGLVLCPNVLVRPMIQDTIFPTVAFVAGPAEISYLAQAAAVYETVGREMPPVYPRMSGTVLEPRVSKLLRKYGFQFSDVFHGREFLKRKAVENVGGADVFQKVKTGVTEQAESLRAVLTAVDPTLVGALDTAKQKMIYQVEALETKFVNAEARRNETMEKQLDLVIHSLFPEKKLQERYLNVASFISRYGLGFLKRLEDSLPLDPTEHHLIEI
jgi:uncharacterized protein YllA (UPF0747 family)